MLIQYCCHQFWPLGLCFLFGLVLLKVLCLLLCGEVLKQKEIEYSFLSHSNFNIQNSWWSNGSNASSGKSPSLEAAGLKMCKTILGYTNPIYSGFY